MPKFHLKQNDTRPSITATLTDANNNPVDLTNADVDFHMTDPEVDTAIVDATATVDTPTDGTVRYDWAPEDTTDAGVYLAEWEVTYANGEIETFPNTTNLVVQIEDELA